MKLVVTALMGWSLLVAPSAAKAQGPQPQPRVLELKASDGTLLKANYFAAATPELTEIIGIDDALWFVQNYVFPPSHAELLSVRGTYKRHDADDESDRNTQSQSAGGSEEGGAQEG